MAVLLMAVLRLHLNPCQSGAAIYAFENQSSLSPLDYAILDQTPALLGSIDLVGDDDLKQILTRIAKFWGNHDQYKSMMHRVQDLSLFPTRAPAQGIARLDRPSRATRLL